MAMERTEVERTEVRGPDATQPLEPDSSLSELLSRLSSDFGDLISTQLELAKVEIKEEVTRAGKSAAMLSGSALAGYLALILLTFAAAWGLSEVMPEGVAFLIVGIVVAAIAAVLFVIGRERMREVRPVPETTETLKEDVQWAKQQMS
jgi:uncharacterized membrane protein YqjE